MPKKIEQSHFSRSTFRFLRELADNNDRAWFAGNKVRYEALVLDPALGFIEAMGPRIAKISDRFVAIPKRSGGSLMRVYRDTRFSRDKTPYKTNIGIQFRHELGKDVHAPGFYVHIEPGGCFLGAGIWHPDAEALACIRAEIAANAPAWRRAAHGKRFTDAFALSGSVLIRPPKGYRSDEPCIDDLKRKDFIGLARLSDSQVLAPDFPAAAARQFGRAKPLMAFLCGALDLRF